MVRVLGRLFCTYGVQEELATDGASVYTNSATRRFLETWGVRNIVSSIYFLHSILRAETCVKIMKRLIANNMGVGGTLGTDSMAAALLTYQNTLGRDTGLSLAQVLFARKMRDPVPSSPGVLQLSLTIPARPGSRARERVGCSPFTQTVSSDPIYPLYLSLLRI